MPNPMGRFPDNTKGLILRKSNKAYRISTYGSFIDHIQELSLQGLGIQCEFGWNNGPTYKHKGKDVDCYDSYVMAYVRRGRYIVDEITFWTVKRYVNRKLHLVRPNAHNSWGYEDFRKKYRLLRPM